MKRLVLKEKIQKIIEVLMMISLMLIISTIESDFTLEYLIFLGINIIVFGGCAKILLKFSKNI